MPVHMSESLLILTPGSRFTQPSIGTTTRANLASKGVLIAVFGFQTQTHICGSTRETVHVHVQALR